MRAGVLLPARFYKKKIIYVTYPEKSPSNQSKEEPNHINDVDPRTFGWDATMKDSSEPRNRIRRYPLKRLRKMLDEEIGAYLDAQGRDHLRLDEMFGLQRPIHFHLSPDKQKMVRPYLPANAD